jgi:hypothetical protein
MFIAKLKPTMSRSIAAHNRQTSPFIIGCRD